MNRFKKVISQRMTVEFDGDFVVFLIGMRINKAWQLHKWIPTALAMLRLLGELKRRPADGYLGHTLGWPVIVMYWRNFDALEAYARAKNYGHTVAWRDLTRRIGRSRGDIGFWHETFLIQANQFEAVYSGMPPFGMGTFGALEPVQGHSETARSRLDAGKS